ncbi:hypothetical protein SNF32_01105 [Enterococcus mundtii]|nr:hypothetical protein [Enterococcus mundtii]
MKVPRLSEVILEGHTFNEKRKDVPLFLEKGSRECARSLRKIKQAEKENEQAMKKLQQELKDYKEAKAVELDQLRASQKQHLEQLLEEKNERNSKKRLLKK